MYRVVVLAAEGLPLNVLDGFATRWPAVTAARAEVRVLERMGIHMLHLAPGLWRDIATTGVEVSIEGCGNGHRGA